jgi:hypothetical protein
LQLWGIEEHVPLTHVPPTVQNRPSSHGVPFACPVQSITTPSGVGALSGEPPSDSSTLVEVPGTSLSPGAATAEPANASETSKAAVAGHPLQQTLRIERIHPMASLLRNARSRQRPVATT